MPFRRLATRSELSGNWRANADPAVRKSNEHARIGLLNNSPTPQDLRTSNSGPVNGTIA